MHKVMIIHTYNVINRLTCTFANSNTICFPSTCRIEAICFFVCAGSGALRLSYTLTVAGVETPIVLTVIQ